MRWGGALAGVAVVGVTVVALLEACSGELRPASPLLQRVEIAATDLNPDWLARDRILGIDVDWAHGGGLGGVVSVDDLTLAELHELRDARFLDPEERQNESPTIAEFIGFLEAHPGATAFGYAVSPERADYRVSVEGLRVPEASTSDSVRADAERFCVAADDAWFAPDIECWWD